MFVKYEPEKKLCSFITKKISLFKVCLSWYCNKPDLYERMYRYQTNL